MNSAIMSRIAKAGVEMDTELRLNSLEVQIVEREVAQLLKGDAYCVVTYVLGGYFDASALSLGYKLSHPLYDIGTSGNNAQTACKCEITFEDACAKIEKVDQAFGQWVYAKGRAAVLKEETSKNLEGQQAQARVLTQAGDAAAEVGRTVLDSATFVSRHLVLISLAVVAVATVVLVKVYLPSPKD